MCAFLPASFGSNICWKSQVDTGKLVRSLANQELQGCRGQFLFPVSLLILAPTLSLSLVLFLHSPPNSTPNLNSLTSSPSLNPLCLFICLLVTLSLHPLLMSLAYFPHPPPPLPPSPSVTGEFPELITGDYPRVQRGPAHLQAEGAREGCLITFSTA